MDITDPLPLGQHAVYALIDPTDEKVYYVGQTRNPHRRLEQHLAARHHKGKKGDWLRGLKQKGQQPLLQILEVVKGEKTALEKEQEWIRHFLEQKMPLLNDQAQPLPSAQGIIPLWQETIILLGYPIIVVQFHNQDTAVSLRSLCNMLKIALAMQVKRIRNDEVLSKQLRQVIIQTSGGPQVCDVLTDWAVPIWASGLNTSRLSEEKQALAVHLQQDAFAAIEQAFTRPEDKTSAPEAPVPEPSPSIIDQIRQRFSLLNTGLTIQTADQQDRKERVTALEGGPARPDVGFSPQRLVHIYVLARQLRQRRGYRVADTLAGLADHFRVEDVSDLAETDWPAALVWFESLLER